MSAHTIDNTDDQTRNISNERGACINIHNECIPNAKVQLIYEFMKRFGGLRNGIVCTYTMTGRMVAFVKGSGVWCVIVERE